MIAFGSWVETHNDYAMMILEDPDWTLYDSGYEPFFTSKTWTVPYTQIDWCDGSSDGPNTWQPILQVLQFAETPSPSSRTEVVVLGWTVKTRFMEIIEAATQGYVWQYVDGTNSNLWAARYGGRSTGITFFQVRSGITVPF